MSGVRPVRPVRSEVSATLRTGPDGLATRPVSGDSEILSGGQSQVRWTTLPDIRYKFRTCPERDRIPFFWDRGGQHTSQKNKNRGISDFSQFHVCFGLAGFQNLLFLFKVNLQDFLNFILVECHQWNNTSRWCLWNGFIKTPWFTKVHLHSVPSNSFPDHWFGFQFFSV